MARTPEELGRPRGDVDPGYGVLSYAVSRRTRELGVRMALGQSPGEVRRTVPRRGMALLGAAAVLGMAGTALLARTAEQLFGVMEPLDPVTCLLTTVVLLGVAAVACWLPARRATRVDPTAALRA
jgi:ABC-type antimicrobial peptide transport system permease subunit